MLGKTFDDSRVTGTPHWHHNPKRVGQVTGARISMLVIRRLIVGRQAGGLDVAPMLTIQERRLRCGSFCEGHSGPKGRHRVRAGQGAGCGRPDAGAGEVIGKFGWSRQNHQRPDVAAITVLEDDPRKENAVIRFGTLEISGQGPSAFAGRQIHFGKGLGMLFDEVPDTIQRTPVQASQNGSGVGIQQLRRLDG